MLLKRGSEKIPYCCAAGYAELVSALAYLQQPLHGMAALPEEPLKTRLLELQTAALEVLSVGLESIHGEGHEKPKQLRLCRLLRCIFVVILHLPGAIFSYACHRGGRESFSQDLSQELPDKRSRQVFLLNNYDAILALMHERRVLPDACTT